MNKDEFFMKQALGQAEKALAVGEFPVGCVIVYGMRVIAGGAREGSSGETPSEIDHAEIVAIRNLNETAPLIPRNELTLYCTMEPCLMCFSAIILSGIKRIVYAYEDPMGGGTGCDLTRLPLLYRESNLTVVPGVMRNESLALFGRFFSGDENTYWEGSLLSEYTLAEAAKQGDEIGAPATASP